MCGRGWGVEFGCAARGVGQVICDDEVALGETTKSSKNSEMLRTHSLHVNIRRTTH